MIENIGISIPSYNESANIIILIEQISANLPNVSIVVVDDSGPMENRRLTKALSSKEIKRKKIILISRLKKSGRGSAVMVGLKELVKDKNIRYFFEMDADLSHNPKEFKIFLDAIKLRDVDAIIGSRYLQKSKTIKWPLWRLVLSRIYNIFINLWLGLNLSDYTNGFRLYNRNTVEFLIGLRLREKGFIALSEIAYRLKTNGYKIIEIPTTFRDRKHGKSNAGLREYLSAIVGIIRIKIFPLSFQK